MKWVVLTLACFVAFSSEALACSGNACDDIVFAFEQNCFKATNHGTRRVKVTMGPYSRIVQRGETWWLQINGVCPRSYVGGDKAVYERN